MEEAVYIKDRKTLRHEYGIGSDVGRAQHVEEQMHEDLPGEENNLENLTDIDFEQPIIEDTFVLDSPGIAMFDGQLSTKAHLHAAAKLR